MKTPPSSIFTPIINAMNKSMSVPFKDSPSFQKATTETTKTFSLQIAEIMRQHWKERQVSLRMEVRSQKDNLYKNNMPLDEAEQKAYCRSLKMTENDIGQVKRKLAKKREWKINTHGKRKLGTKHEPANKRNKTCANLTPSMSQPKETSTYETEYNTVQLCTDTSTPAKNTPSADNGLSKQPFIRLNLSPVHSSPDSWQPVEDSYAWQKDIDSVHFTNSSDSDSNSEHGNTDNVKQIEDNRAKCQSGLQQTPPCKNNVNDWLLHACSQGHTTTPMNSTIYHSKGTQPKEKNVESNITSQTGMNKTTEIHKTTSRTCENTAHAVMCTGSLSHDQAILVKPQHTVLNILEQQYDNTGPNQSEQNMGYKLPEQTNNVILENNVEYTYMSCSSNSTPDGYMTRNSLTRQHSTDNLTPSGRSVTTCKKEIKPASNIQRSRAQSRFIDNLVYTNMNTYTLTQDHSINENPQITDLSLKKKHI